MIVGSIVNGRPGLAVICICAFALAIVAFGGMVRDRGTRR